MAYNKTEWVNNETPINEVNLNNIENGIEQALATPNILVCKIAGTTDIVPSSAGDIVLTLEECEKIGTKLSVADGGVVIPEGVNYILVNAIANIDCSSVSGVRNMVILQNNVVKAIYALTKGSAWWTGVIPDTLLQVAEGDVITLRIYAQKDDKIKPAQERTTLTVKVVENV